MATSSETSEMVTSLRVLFLRSQVQFLSRLAALYTTRYRMLPILKIVRSSIIPPLGLQRREYWPLPTASLDTSFVVRWLRNDSAPFPSARTRPIWETSNIPQLFLTLWHSGIMPSNQTERSKPAYSTMLPCFL